MKFVQQIGKKVAMWQEVAKSGDTPTIAKVYIFVAVFYLFMPFDLIPDFIPIIGFLDDIVVVSLLLWLAAREIERAKEELDETRKAAKLNQQDHCETL